MHFSILDGLFGGMTIPFLSSEWWVVNLLSWFFLLTLLILSRKFSMSFNARLSFCLGILMLLRSVFIYGYVYFIGEFSLQEWLPLHLCRIASVVVGLSLLFRSRWLFNFAYFWGIPCGVMAFFLPEIDPDKYLLFDFFIYHWALAFAPLYLLVTGQRMVTKGGWFKVFLWSQVLFVSILWVNSFLGSNYIFLSEKPQSFTFALFGTWPWNNLILDVCFLFFILLSLIPVYMMQRKKKRGG
jgi:hypothetical integral membrane protein (TIGR02206 family)